MSADHGYGYYVKVWAGLMVLFAISVIGPSLEIMWLTLITAFGVAVVKALMVAAYFLHLNVEKRYIWLLLIGALLFLGAFYAGLAPDIQNNSGTNWVHCNGYNDANKARILAEAKIADDHHPGLVDHITDGKGAGALLLPGSPDCTPQRF